MSRSWMAVVLLAVPAMGCTSFDELDFTFRSVPPTNVNISFDQITIQEGIGVGVIARPLDDGKEMDTDTTVDLESKNPGVLVVGPSLPNAFEEDDEDKENWTFLIYGVAPGTTEVSVRIDGELLARIPATVVAQ